MEEQPKNFPASYVMCPKVGLHPLGWKEIELGEFGPILPSPPSEQDSASERRVREWATESLALCDRLREEVEPRWRPLLPNWENPVTQDD